MRTHAAAEGGRSGMWLLYASVRVWRDSALEDRVVKREEGSSAPDLVQAEVAFDILCELHRVARFARVCTHE